MIRDSAELANKMGDTLKPDLIDKMSLFPRLGANNDSEEKIA